MVLFIMAIFLTHQPGEISAARKLENKNGGLLALPVSPCGIIIIGTLCAPSRSDEPRDKYTRSGKRCWELKYQFLLPFETISLLLLASSSGPS